MEAWDYGSNETLDVLITERAVILDTSVSVNSLPIGNGGMLIFGVGGDKKPGRVIKTGFEINNAGKLLIFFVHFLWFLCSIVLIASLLGKFTDFVPTTFQIMLYTIYQLGITFGIFFITRRKESDVLSEIK